MKTILNFSILVLLLFAANPLFAQTTTYVPGYVKKNGTYVAPHFKTTPNKTKADNFSTKPNINPYTGKVGTKTNPDPYLTTPPPVIYTPPLNTTYPPSNTTEEVEEPEEEQEEQEASQCLGTTKSGNQCRRMTKDPTGFCYQHQ